MFSFQLSSLLAPLSILHLASSEDCTKENIEQLQQCFTTTGASPDLQLVVAEMFRQFPQCLPGYSSDQCPKKYSLMNTCWKQLQLTTAMDTSLTGDIKDKSLISLYKCMPPFFPYDLWRFMAPVLQQAAGATGGTGATSAQSAPYQSPPIANQFPSLDPCIPAESQITCLVQALLKNVTVQQASIKTLGLIKNCYGATPAPCRFPITSVKYECNSPDMKPIVDKYRGLFQDCFTKDASSPASPASPYGLR